MSGPPSGPSADLLTPPGTTEDAREIRRRAQRLRQLGFHESTVVDPSTGRPALMWARVWRGVRDAVIASADGAVAYRIWDDDFDPHNPFLTEPDLLVWSGVGTFLEVSAKLLAQEAMPDHSHFPSARDQDAAGEQAGSRSGHNDQHEAA